MLLPNSTPSGSFPPDGQKTIGRGRRCERRKEEGPECGLVRIAVLPAR